MKRRVVKVGGSLLSGPNFMPRLKAWLASNSNMQNILVIGGGDMADAVRRMHELLNDEKSHEFACRAMSLNARALACSIVAIEFSTHIDQLKKTDNSTVIFDSLEWILGCSSVPATWDFTSDSIAAKLATTIDADELVLIKSRMGALDEPGFVDVCFADESQSVKSIRVSTLDS